MILKNSIIVSTVIIQLMLIFLAIYTQSKIIGVTYALQDAEKTAEQLEKRDADLTHQLLRMKEPSRLKKIALSDFHMRKAQISDIKQLPLIHGQ